MQIKPGMWSSKDRLFLLFRKSGVQFVFLVLFGGGFHVIFMLFVFIYIYWYQTWFLYHMVPVSPSSNAAVATSRARTANLFETHAFTHVLLVFFPFSVGHCILSVLRFTALESSIYSFFEISVYLSYSK
jgi:hypothetical protein